MCETSLEDILEDVDREYGNISSILHEIFYVDRVNYYKSIITKIDHQ